MTQRKHYFFLILTVFLLIFAAACKSTKPSVLILSELQNEQSEFQYKEIEWGMSAEQVKAQKGWNWQQMEGTSSSIQGVENYYAVDSVSLQGITGTCRLELVNDQACSLYFTFKQEKSDSAVFETIHDELLNLYGEPDKTSTSNTDQLYLWKTDNTMLQASYLPDKSNSASIIITIGAPSYAN